MPLWYMVYYILLYITLQIHSVEHSYGLGGESLRETFTICITHCSHIKLCFVVLKAWVEKQYKLSNLVSLSAGLGQRRSINKQNGGLGYLVFGCPLTSFALRKLGLFEFIFLNN